MIFRATVTTNCEDDDYRRVKVKNKYFWPQESGLLPSVNSIYLNKNDSVIVLVENALDLTSAVILGKVLDKQQSDPVDSNKILFSAHKDSDWVIATEESTGLKIESSKGIKVEGFYEDVKVTTPSGTEVSITDDDIVLSVNGSGKISLANAAINLSSVLDDLLQAFLTTIPTTIGSPTAQNFSPNLVQEITTAKTKLSQLLK